MTKKHFIAIAQILNQNKPLGADNEIAIGAKLNWEDIVLALTTYFETENPNFDRERFVKACG